MNPSPITRQISRPFILVNMAMTADGKIATANRVVSSFGSVRDQKHLLELRTTVDAVMAGARTVDSAHVNLGPGPAKYRHKRLKNRLSEYNLRVIVSGSGTLDPLAEVFKHRFSPIIVLTTQRASPMRLRQLRAIADEVKVLGRHEINFGEAFAWLRQRWGVKRLLCEGGGSLNDALFRGGFVDELHLTICPTIFGGRRAPTIADGTGFGRVANAFPLRLKSFQSIRGESFAVFQRTGLG
jgi:2,5-diamino-6-(ribosylamino)-4(3H)-pyrimidinone 5'-phosphate reductase